MEKRVVFCNFLSVEWGVLKNQYPFIHLIGNKQVITGGIYEQNYTN